MNTFFKSLRPVCCCIAATLLLSSCEQPLSPDLLSSSPSASVRFNIQGDFSSPTFTRGSLSADGKSMTDLWIFDYMSDALVAQYHQSSTDDDFGTPEISLDYGTHTLYFVASRGKTPTVNTNTHLITWGTTSDTFYKSHPITVSSGSDSEQAITLTRVATKLDLTIKDAIPEGLSSVTITPATWYYGINYLTGAPADAQETPREISIPAAQAGAVNTTLSIFGLSSSTEWTTNISIVGRDSEDNILGQATITAAPFKSSRATGYSGNLFTSNSTFTVSLSDSWDTSHSGTW